MSVPSLAAYRTPSSPEPLRAWEVQMERSRRAALQGPASLARSCGAEAVVMARQLVESPPLGHEEDCVVALVVSHLNLADVDADEGLTDGAAEQLGHAHEEVMALVLSHPNAPLQRAALRHSRETHAGLLRHLSLHGPHPAITRALRAGCATLSVASHGPGPAH